MPSPLQVSESTLDRFYLLNVCILTIFYGYKLNIFYSCTACIKGDGITGQTGYRDLGHSVDHISTLNAACFFQ